MLFSASTSDPSTLICQVMNWHSDSQLKELFWEVMNLNPFPSDDVGTAILVMPRCWCKSITINCDDLRNQQYFLTEHSFLWHPVSFRSGRFLLLNSALFLSVYWMGIYSPSPCKVLHNLFYFFPLAVGKSRELRWTMKMLCAWQQGKANGYFCAWRFLFDNSTVMYSTFRLQSYSMRVGSWGTLFVNRHKDAIVIRVHWDNLFSSLQVLKCL